MNYFLPENIKKQLLQYNFNSSTISDEELISSLQTLYLNMPEALEEIMKKNSHALEYILTLIESKLEKNTIPETPWLAIFTILAPIVKQFPQYANKICTLVVHIVKKHKDSYQFIWQTELLKNILLSDVTCSENIFYLLENIDSLNNLTKEMNANLYYTIDCLIKGNLFWSPNILEAIQSKLRGDKNDSFFAYAASILRKISAKHKETLPKVIELYQLILSSPVCSGDTALEICDKLVSVAEHHPETIDKISKMLGNVKPLLNNDADDVKKLQRINTKILKIKRIKE